MGGGACEGKIGEAARQTLSQEDHLEGSPSMKANGFRKLFLLP